VGHHLLARLAQLGAGPLVSIDIRPPRAPVAGVDYLRHDIRDLSGLTLPQPVGLIFNLAAVHTTPGHAPWEYYDANVRGALEVVRLARAQGTARICFTSSISVYGPTEAALDETAPPRPVSDYGRSKLMAERIFTDWAQADPARQLVIARPAVVFGAGEGGNFTRLARLLDRGMFIYPGRRDTIKSCIYVGDLVEWMLHALDGPDRLTLFNAAFHDRYTIETIVETFRKVAFPRARTLTLPSPALKLVASLLRPISRTGLGLHPERIEKLMRSTNILPGWAEAQGLATRDRLQPALEAWRDQTAGTFT
jgi:nucleoside-diphosphate-sugar epimerase